MKKNNLRLLQLSLLALAFAASAPLSQAAVTLTADTSTRTATISTATVTVKFNSAGKGTYCSFNGQELIGGRAGFYMSNTATAWSPTSLVVVTNTSAMVDIAYKSAMGEHHYVVRDGVNGFYSYFISGNMGGAVGEFRTLYRVNPSLFPNNFNMKRSGTPPTLAQIQAATVIQDSTYQLANGSIYSKYDYVDYVANDHVHGVYGSSYGLWVIPVSTEALNGGPMKQELTVHVESNTGDATVLNMLTASHFSPPAVTVPSGKIYGPWLVYLNNGSSADAVARASTEEAAWPYTWLSNSAYPTTRYAVQGKLQIADGRSTNGALVVLAQPGGDLYAMGTAYWFSAACDSAGNFSIPKVRPGTYTLYAYATQGDVTAQYQKSGTVVVSNAAVNLGTLTWTPPNYAAKLWTIGTADRKAGEFKLGNQLRSYALFKQVPANLTYTIGTSTPANNWYFAQTGVGKWTVNFNLSQTYTGNAHLSIAVAGSAQAPNVNVLVNGTKVGALNYPNDSCVYRSANQGAYYRFVQFDFASSLLHTGANSVVFDMTSCAGAPTPGGIEYDIIKLEADGSAGNVAPTVSITSPANGATFAAGANITLNANAADSDGSVSKVDFYQGSTLLGTDTSSPYSFTWNGVAAGSYALTAKATDNGGATTTSAAVNITVGTSATTYQAESAVLGGGSVVESTNGGFNGTGYVNFPTSGGTLTFNSVNGGTGGSKTLSFRAANGTTAARTGAVVINGVSQPIAFGPTGAWTTWTDTAITVNLNSGTSNTIQLQSNGQDLANIDQLQVP